MQAFFVMLMAASEAFVVSQSIQSMYYLLVVEVHSTKSTNFESVARDA